MNRIPLERLGKKDYVAKVIFIDKTGRDNERIEAVKDGLIVGHEYETESLEIGGFWSTVKLKGFDKPYNTVMFLVKD